MSGSTVVPSSFRPSLEMRRSRSSSSLSDAQSAASISRTVSACAGCCHVFAPSAHLRYAVSPFAAETASAIFEKCFRRKSFPHVFVNRVFDRLKPIEIVADGISNQSYFFFGQAAFKNFTGDLLEIINIYRVNNFFATLLFHRCIQSHASL